MGPIYFHKIWTVTELAGQSSELIISNSYKFIFVHLPKCAGTTTSQVLSDVLHAQDVDISTPQNRSENSMLGYFKANYGLRKHSTADQIAKALAPGTETDFRWIYSARNPYSRFESAYYYTLSDKSEDEKFSREYAHLSLEEFVQSGALDSLNFLQFRTQSSFLLSKPHEKIILRTESLDADIKKLKDQLDLPLSNAATPRKNVNPSKGKIDWSTIGAPVTEYVRTRYQIDFVNFGYDPDAI